MTTQDQGQTTATLRSLNMRDVLIAKQDFLIQAIIDRFCGRIRFSLLHDFWIIIIYWGWN